MNTCCVLAQPRADRSPGRGRGRRWSYRTTLQSRSDESGSHASPPRRGPWTAVYVLCRCGLLTIPYRSSAVDRLDSIKLHTRFISCTRSRTCTSAATGSWPGAKAPSACLVSSPVRGVPYMLACGVLLMKKDSNAQGVPIKSVYSRGIESGASVLKAKDARIYDGSCRSHGPAAGRCSRS